MHRAISAPMGAYAMPTTEEDTYPAAYPHSHLGGLSGFLGGDIAEGQQQHWQEEYPAAEHNALLRCWGLEGVEQLLDASTDTAHATGTADICRPAGPPSPAPLSAPSLGLAAAHSYPSSLDTTTTLPPPPLLLRLNTALHRFNHQLPSHAPPSPPHSQATHTTPFGPSLRLPQQACAPGVNIHPLRSPPSANPQAPQARPSRSKKPRTLPPRPSLPSSPYINHHPYLPHAPMAPHLPHLSSKSLTPLSSLSMASVSDLFVDTAENNSPWLIPMDSQVVHDPALQHSNVPHHPYLGPTPGFPNVSTAHTVTQLYRSNSQPLPYQTPPCPTFHATHTQSLPNLSTPSSPNSDGDPAHLPHSWATCPAPHPPKPHVALISTHPHASPPTTRAPSAPASNFIASVITAGREALHSHSVNSHSVNSHSSAHSSPRQHDDSSYDSQPAAWDLSESDMSILDTLTSRHLGIVDPSSEQPSYFGAMESLNLDQDLPLLQQPLNTTSPPRETSGPLPEPLYTKLPTLHPPTAYPPTPASTHLPFRHPPHPTTNSLHDLTPLPPLAPTTSPPITTCPPPEHRVPIASRDNTPPLQPATQDDTLTETHEHLSTIWTFNTIQRLRPTTPPSNTPHHKPNHPPRRPPASSCPPHLWQPLGVMGEVLPQQQQQQHQAGISFTMRPVMQPVVYPSLRR